MVSNGTWKDYGMSMGPKEISFNAIEVLRKANFNTLKKV